MTQLYAIVPVGRLDDGRPDNSLPGGGFAPVDPGYGQGGGGHPDNSLPGGGAHPWWGGGRPDRPSQPIYHPGHPDHGRPSRPDNSLPWSPGHPDNSLPVPPGVTPPAEVPPDLASKLVVLWHLPNTVEWHGKVIDPSLVAGMPLPPAPEPK